MSTPRLDLEKSGKPSREDPEPENADNVSVKSSNPFEVALEPQDDPKSLPLWRRWIVALIINAGAICVTGASSMVHHFC